MNVRAMECVCAQTRLVYTLIRKNLVGGGGGMESEPMLTPREKSPLPEKFSQEDRTHDAASSRTASPTHYQQAISDSTRVHSQSMDWFTRGLQTGFICNLWNCIFQVYVFASPWRLHILVCGYSASTESSFLTLCSVNVYLCTLGKQECRLAMHAGSCIAWSMGSSLTDRCRPTRPLEEEMIRSTLSSVRLAPGNMFHELSLWILSQLLSVRPGPVMVACQTGLIA